jgi:S-layer homology domain
MLAATAVVEPRIGEVSMEPWQPTLSTGSDSLLRRHRRLAVVGVAALILALPVAVSASHQFSDVPTSSTYHTSVSRLVGAGLTGGCGGGKYCPNNAVTRGQMAAFLNRGLGRAAYHADTTVDDHWAVLTGSIPGPAVTYLTAGGAGGGTAHVLGTGSIDVFTDEAGVCPCELRMALFSSDGEISAIGSTIISDTPSPDDGYRKGGVSMSHLFTVKSGASTGFTILVAIYTTNPPSLGNVADATFDLQATYVPFQFDGGNPPALATTRLSKPPFGVAPFPIRKSD